MKHEFPHIREYKIVITPDDIHTILSHSSRMCLVILKSFLSEYKFGTFCSCHKLSIC